MLPAPSTFHLQQVASIAPEFKGGGKRENPAPPLTETKVQLPGMQDGGTDCPRVDASAEKSRCKRIGVGL